MPDESVSPRPHLTWILPREGWVLVALTLAALLLFLVTSSLVSVHRAEQSALGREWFLRGEKALAAGRPDEALDALRTALVYDRESLSYHFRLAQALLASGRQAEARAYLIGLFEQEPGSGPIGLELGRLEARAGRYDDAITYLRAASRGAWESDTDAHRLRVKVELAELLLGQGQEAEALAELIAVAARLPPDAALHARVADLFRRAGDRSRALEEYRAILRRHPDDATALLGAGRVAFEAQDFARSASYLRRAAARGAEPEARDLLQTAEAVITADPFAPRLSVAERAKRAARAVALAKERLAGCAPGGEGDPLQALRGRLAGSESVWSARALAREPERIDAAMELVYAVEREASARCGPPTAADRTLLLLAGKREAEAP